MPPVLQLITIGVTQEYSRYDYLVALGDRARDTPNPRRINERSSAERMLKRAKWSPLDDRRAGSLE
jgi:hypothetical protein